MEFSRLGVRWPLGHTSGTASQSQLGPPSGVPPTVTERSCDPLLVRFLCPHAPLVGMAREDRTHRNELGRKGGTKINKLAR